MKRAEVYALIDAERDWQEERWPADDGHFDASDARLAILGEEVGELAEALASGSPSRVREELVDVGAVVVRWLECGVLPVGEVRGELSHAAELLKAAGAACREWLERPGEAA